MNKNFYYGSVISTADNDASPIRAGNIFWVLDGSNATRHPYLVANSFMHEKNPVIYAWVIDSKPYCSDMIPFTMNTGISYINPFKIYAFKLRDFRRECYHGTISAEVYNLTYKMYTLMFNRTLADDIISEYDEYCKRFFNAYAEIAIEAIAANDNSLAFQSSLTGFDIVTHFKLTTTTDSDYETMEVNEKEIRDFYDELTKKSATTTDILDTLDEADKILFIGLKKLYKLNDICIAIAASTSTYYKRLKEFKAETGIGTVIVKLENGKLK